MVKHVNSEELESLKQTGMPVVCDFWASWCGPCRMLAPVFEETSEKYQGKVQFVKIDVDEETSSAVKYGVSSIPCLIFFKDGEVKGRHVGFAPAEALSKFIDNNL